MGTDASQSELGLEFGPAAGLGQLGTHGRLGSPWQRKAAPSSLLLAPLFWGLMTESSWSDAFQ